MAAAITITRMTTTAIIIEVVLDTPLIVFNIHTPLGELEYSSIGYYLSVVYILYPVTSYIAYFTRSTRH